MRRVNISIDDVSPHPRSSIKVIDNCVRILKRVPSAKFTLFVPTAYWRTIPSPPESMCVRPLSLVDHPVFCKQLSLLPESIFEIGFHGHHHGIPGSSNNDELKSVNFNEAKTVYEKMFAATHEAGLISKFKMILRPPAWRLSPDAFDAARGVFDILALNPDPMYFDVYGGKQHEDFWKQRIVYQDAAPPIVSLPSEWDSLEIVTHACEWDKNYLSEELADRIASLMIEREAVGTFMGDLLGKV